MRAENSKYERISSAAEHLRSIHARKDVCGFLAESQEASGKGETLSWIRRTVQAPVSERTK
jgi:hypothetical protein